ncbi:MAG TPA: Crp/Fnr family transcriptional regulator [Xanthobacteraceae bacterium]|jgi:CRP-like cAMP-binding protein|nr:Crp/Fnr family transcriptional regulator [Xanthobacteraceae bacterium]
MASHARISSSGQITGVLVRTLRRHSQLTAADVRVIAELRPHRKTIGRGQDIVRQGDRPKSSVLVLRGTLGRYHTFAAGMRQYLQLHIEGDLPDLQSLFLHVMDHSLAAIEEAEIALLPHGELRNLILKAPQVGFALWRHTLIDASIFRQAITNQGLRSAPERVAHFLCQHFALTREFGLADGSTCSFPLNQQQIGQFLGLSIVSVNRALQALRKDGCAELAAGKLRILSWHRISSKAAFDPTYLHLNLQAPHLRAGADLGAPGRSLA